MAGIPNDADTDTEYGDVRRRTWTSLNIEHAFSLEVGLGTISPCMLASKRIAICYVASIILTEICMHLLEEGLVLVAGVFHDFSSPSTRPHGLTLLTLVNSG